MQVTIGIEGVAAIIGVLSTLFGFAWWIISGKIAQATDRIEATIRTQIEVLKTERKGDVELFNDKVGRLRIDHDKLERSHDGRLRHLERITGSGRVFDPTDSE